MITDATSSNLLPKEIQAPNMALNGGKLEVVFIDTSVEDWGSLASDIETMRPGVEIELIDGTQSGFAQLADWARAHSGYDAIHILSHGTDASLDLGTDDLTTASLASETTQREWAQIGQALNPGGDLLLYGCDIAAGTQGNVFVNDLAQASHAVVAASADATGATTLGGNWTLEKTTEPLQIASLALTYSGLLAQPISGTTNFNTVPGPIIVSGSSTGSGLPATNVDGWDFTLQSASATNCYIGAEALTGETILIDGVSDDGTPLSDMTVKADDGYLFTLHSVDLAMSGPSVGSSRTLELIGYRNGVAVSGATLSETVTDADIGGDLVTFNVSANSKFQGIDSFRVETDGSYQITGAFGIDNIDATNFLPLPPVLATSGGSAAFVAGDNATSAPITVDTGVSVSDGGSSTLASGTVSLTGNFHSSEDVLAFSNTSAITFGNVSASYNSSTGVLTLTSSGASATLAQWQAAFQAITYTDTAITPSNATRTISFVVNDGTQNSVPVTRTVTVADTDQTPIVTTDSGSAAFVAGDNVASLPVAVDSGISLSDRDNTTLASATVSLTGNFHSSEDVLAFSNTSAITFGNVSASYNGSTGVLTLTSSGASATLAQWQAAFQAVTYTNTAITPNNATRTISFVVNDGAENSTVATRAVTVTDTDQTPIVTTDNGSAAFVAGDNVASLPIAVDSGISVSDRDNTTLASATVSLTGNFHSSEDLLAFSNTSAITFGDVSASYNGSTGVLTLTSSGASATLAQWQAALRAITYTNTAITPNNATRTISFVVNEGAENSTVATRAVTVADTDQTPIVTTDSGSPAFVAGDNVASLPVAVDSGISVSDRDSTTLASATVSLTGNFHGGEDLLAFINTSAITFGNVSASYNGSTGVLTLTSSGASATLAQWQAALQAVTYTNTAITPSNATRTISFVVNDGAEDSVPVTRTVTVADTDQTPIVTTEGGSAAFVAGDNVASLPVAVDSGISVSDRDGTTLASATVSLTGNFHSSEDVLAFSNTSATTFGNVSAGYNSSTGVLTLTSSGASATLAQWQAAFQAVTYTNTAVIPNNATRTISFVVNDGTQNSVPVTRTLTVADTDQTPIVTTDSGSAAFVAGDNVASVPVAVDSGISLSDRDSTSLASVTVSLTGNFHGSEDLLAFINTSAITFGNVSASYNGSTGVLTLTSSGASATLAQWQAALQAVTYTNTAVIPNNATRTISFVVNDGTEDSTAATRSVTVADTDQTPVVTTDSGSAAFVAGDNVASLPVAVDSGISVSDRDNTTLASATVSLTGNFHSSEDVLAFSNTSAITFGNVSASYNSSTGVLTLNSSGASATLAQWQAALQAVTYTNTAVIPNNATRTISFVVNDGAENSVPVTRTVTVAETDQTPIVTTDSGSAAFVAGDNVASLPVGVDSGISVFDPDSSTLASATVSIIGNFHAGEDLLAFSNTGTTTFGNISASYSTSTGVLTLTSSDASATLAQWQAAFQAITYTDTAITPSNATRTISFVVNDGTQNSVPVTRTVTVADTDQTPIVTTDSGSAAFVAGDNVASLPVAVDSGISLSDRDNTTLASATVSLTGNFHSSEDVLAFSNTSAITFGNVSASYNGSTGVLTLTSSGASATLAQWQAAFQAVTYTNTAITPNNATRTISFVVNDGTEDSTAASRSVTVADTVADTVTTPPSGLTLSPGSDSGVAGDDLTNIAFPVIAGVGIAGDTVSVYDGADPTPIGTDVASDDGTWSIAVTTGLADGSHSLTAKESIPGGTTSSASGSLVIAIDTTPPAISLSSAAILADTDLPVITGTSTPGSAVSLRIDSTALGTTTADMVTGSWTYTVASHLAQGAHQITAQATDIAGNASAVTPPSTLFVISDPSNGVSSAVTSDTAPLTLANQLLGATPQFVSGTQSIELSDGTLSVGPDTQQAFLERLYEGLFGRTSDLGGLGYWNDQLTKGMGAADVATGFLNSSEGKAATAGLTDQQYVSMLYRGLLHRAGGTDEIDHWTNTLAEGASRGQVLADIADSSESRTALAADTSNVFAPNLNAELVILTYETAFRREPETNGFHSWTHLLNNGVSVADFENSVAGSAEFQATYGGETTGQILMSLYQNGLGRDPNGAEMSTYGGGTQTNAGLLGMVAQSLEALAHLQSKL